VASSRLTLGVGIAVAAGFAVIIGAAVWAFHWHGSGAHQAMHSGHHGSMEGPGAHQGGGAAYHHEGQEGHDAAEHHESGEHHEEGYEQEMSAREDSSEHHGQPADSTDTADLKPTGRVQDGVRTIEMQARQFEFVPSTVVVREGETVRLEVTSQDVTHGLAVEAYDIDKRLPPHETVTVEFTADQPGRRHFHCSVFCGAGHERMHGTLVVLADEFGATGGDE